MLKNLKSEKEYYLKQLELARKEIDSLRKGGVFQNAKNNLDNATDVSFTNRNCDESGILYSAERRQTNRSMLQSMTPGTRRENSCNQRSASPTP